MYLGVTHLMGVAVGYVLRTGKHGAVPGVAQGGGEVLGGIAKAEATVGETHHAALMRRLAGEHAGATGRAGRRAGVRAAEEDALLGQPLQVRGVQAVTVRLDVSPGVVRMQVEDVRSGGVGHRLWLHSG